jgi:hypothetical protein
MEKDVFESEDEEDDSVELQEAINKEHRLDVLEHKTEAIIGQVNHLATAQMLIPKNMGKEHQAETARVVLVSVKSICKTNENSRS